ncbi:MAG: PH domain-containing protein [Nevskia sp.]|nr:PH domain-containing protein [Nevskia sp.]
MSFDFKNAKPAQLKAEYDRIAKELGDDQFFTRKELNHLPQILGDGEQVLAFTSGLMDADTWLITLTDRRIIFLDKGMIYGLKQTTIDLDKINSITGETGIFFGKIKIEDGAKEREIDNVWKKTVVKFTNKTRDAIEARKRPQQIMQVKGPNEDDVVSKLERLAALLEKGILSTEEFQQQKAKLLAL